MSNPPQTRKTHQTNALERKHRSPDEQRELLLIKQRHVRNPTLHDDPDFSAKDVHQPRKNEHIRNECGGGELGDIADEGHGEEEDDLEEDEGLHGEELEAVGDAEDEGLEGFGDEDCVC